VPALPGRAPSRPRIVVGTALALVLAFGLVRFGLPIHPSAAPSATPADSAPTAADALDRARAGAGLAGPGPAGSDGASTDADDAAPASYASLVPAGQLPVEPGPAALVAEERERRAAGDYTGALDALARLEARVGPTGLGPYLSLHRATCYAKLRDWPRARQAAQAALASDGGGPRLARIDAYERLGEASLALGATTDALDAYSHALELAGTPAYRAEMLFTTGRLAYQAGQDALAVERLRAVVVEMPDQRRAADALDLLIQMDESAVVSPLQAGLARAHAGQLQAALADFEQVDEAGSGSGLNPDAGAAHVAHAAALARLGRESEALAELDATASAAPADAGAALLQAGRILERDDRYADADDVYSSIPQRASNTTAVIEGLFRAGLTRYLRADWAGAQAAWQWALDPAYAPPPPLAAQVHFWRGKALAKQGGAASADAQAAWARAAELGADSYYGFRAQDMLRGELVPTVGAATPTPSFDLPAEQQQERAQWLSGLQLSPRRVAADLAAEPGFARASQLLGLGLTTEAGWELEGLARRYAGARDLAHLDAVGEWTLARGLPDQALAIGRLASDAAGGAVLPRPLQRSLYPAGYADLAVRQATSHGVDPLLLLAVVRQESGFVPTAQSKAGALGLAQVVPATGHALAQQLGQPDRFETGDLLKPDVSLAFGSAYLATVTQHYGGQLLPTIASYNAGAGAVDRWLRALGDDPDLLYEQAPYEETHSYIERVYVNYRAYAQLYGQT
jgi:soluble lytic murein transglycosylase